MVFNQTFFRLGWLDGNRIDTLRWTHFTEIFSLKTVQSIRNAPETNSRPEIRKIRIRWIWCFYHKRLKFIHVERKFTNKFVRSRVKFVRSYSFVINIWLFMFVFWCSFVKIRTWTTKYFWRTNTNEHEKFMFVRVCATSRCIQWKIRLLQIGWKALHKYYSECIQFSHVKIFVSILLFEVLKRYSMNGQASRTVCTQKNHTKIMKK